MSSAVSLTSRNNTARLNALDWSRIAQELDAQGHAILERLIPHDECRAIVLWPSEMPQSIGAWTHLGSTWVATTSSTGTNSEEIAMGRMQV